MTVHIAGANLTSLAAALRLARADHRVSVHDARLTSDDAAVWVPRGLPPILRLPAAWRDLFTKSGRPMDAELATRGLTLAPAPPTVHRFADGSELALPDERGAQFHAIAARFGTPAAQRWADVLDQLDDVWQAMRRLGLEAPFDRAGLDRASKQQLLASTTLATLADRLEQPQLARILIDQAALAGTQSRRAPALLGTGTTVERTFGRWYLADRDQRPVRAEVLVQILLDRLARRGVELASDEARHPDIDCYETGPARAGTGRVWAGFVPATRTAGTAAQFPLTEIVDHTDWAPVRTWRLPTPEGGWQRVDDHTRAFRYLPGGLEPASFTAWTLRAPLTTRTGLHASASSHAGGEPWAMLLTGALATYQIHQARTGEDIRPTNPGSSARVRRAPR